MTRILAFVGTRPEIIKMAPVIRALQAKRSVELVLGHSGQHYDMEMSQVFIRQLGLPRPDFNIEAGPGSHAMQSSRIMMGCETAIRRYEPDVVVAQGDTNTVVAVGLASVKLQVPFAHVEAGLRSFDRTMPEEINRVLADHCAELCFAPSEIAATNLMREGIMPQRIAVTGNTIVDACLANLPLAERFSRVSELIGTDIADRDFCLLTAHRAENVDSPQMLRRLVSLILKLKNFSIIYPVHPRARTRFQKFGLWKKLRRQKNVVLLPPLSYWDFLWLLSRCRFVLTDSGGVQEEAFTLGVPCVTLRDNTERPETVISGCNVVTGLDSDRVYSAIANIQVLQRSAASIRENPLGDGRAGRRIAHLLITRARSKTGIEHSSFPLDGYATRMLISAARLRQPCKLHLISMAYNSHGELKLPAPHRNMIGWHVEIFGEPAVLKRCVRENYQKRIKRKGLTKAAISRHLAHSRIHQ